MYVMQREKDEENKSQLSTQSKVSWSHFYTDVVQHDSLLIQSPANIFFYHSFLQGKWVCNAV